MNLNATSTPPLAHTPREAARLLGLSEPAIRARIFRGQLPVQRWRRRLLIRHDVLERILTDQPRQSAPIAKRDRS